MFCADMCLKVSQDSKAELRIPSLCELTGRRVDTPALSDCETGPSWEAVA